VVVVTIAWVALEGAWGWTTEPLVIGVICGVFSHGITGTTIVDF
jgi:hypothetical protein